MQAVSGAESSGGAPAPICFGDSLRIWAVSAYAVSTADRRGGFIGTYHKAGRWGALTCVPPLGQPYQALYEPSVFTILDPTHPREHLAQLNSQGLGPVLSSSSSSSSAASAADASAAGSSSSSGGGSSGEYGQFARRPVRYGDELMLIDHEGNTLNNRLGSLVGYLGPRPLGTPGECVFAFMPARPPANSSLLQQQQDAAVGRGGSLPSTSSSGSTSGAGASPSPSSSSSSGAVARPGGFAPQLGDVITFADPYVYIDVKRSLRARIK